MAAKMTNSTHGHTAILSVFLLAVIASGIPQVETHAHKDAYFGHEHRDHQNETQSSEDVDGLADSSTMHAHELGVSAVTLITVSNLKIVINRRRNGGIPPPTARPPDNVTAPLYRPPIV